MPAAALAVSAIQPDHESVPCLVGLANDAGDRFLTVVISEGAPAVLSEALHDGVDAWIEALRTDGLGNGSVARVYVPEDRAEGLADGAAAGKLVPFSPQDLVVPAGIAPLRRLGRWRWIAAGLVSITISAGLVTTIWWWFLGGGDPDPDETAAQWRTEVSRLDMEPLLAHCDQSLAAFWPMAPEWTLVEEGCVLDPADRPSRLPVVAGDGAYAYRLYTLAREWNEYLAGRAADSVTARFAGDVAREPARRLLYRLAPRRERLVNETYRPTRDVGAILDQLFVGRVETGEPFGVGAINARTPLELRATLRRVTGADLDIVHARREIGSGETVFRVRPVQLRTEKIRIGDEGGRE